MDKRSAGNVGQASERSPAAVATRPVNASAERAGHIRSENRDDDFQRVLLLVGRLNYTWTNTESLLIYLIAGLAKVDKETAIVIFLTLNTTRARLDLVERLAKMTKTGSECRKDIQAITGDLARLMKLRNKYNHCIYAFDEKGRVSHTQMMRIFDGKDDIKYGKIESLDRAEMSRIESCINDIATTNRQIWKVVRENRFPT
jgi:hypothetical protein